MRVAALRAVASSGTRGEGGGGGRGGSRPADPRWQSREERRALGSRWEPSRFGDSSGPSWREPPPPPPNRQRELQREEWDRRAAAQLAADSQASAEDGHTAEREDLSLFRPRILTRPAKDTSDADFFAGSTWRSLGCSPDVVVALESMGCGRPSHIQAAALRDWRDVSPAAGAATVICDAAGSGKTLAYLVPLIQSLRDAESAGGARPSPRRPHALILTPTEELAGQVLSVCKLVSSAGAKFRSAAATGGHKLRSQAEALQDGLAVLVGTPGRIRALVNQGVLELSDLRTFVLDECDILLGTPFGFLEDVLSVRQALLPGTRCVLATATLPDAAVQDAEGVFQRLRIVAGPNLHRPAAGVEERGGSIGPEAGFRRKAEALNRVLFSTPSSRTIVFCNKIETCRAVENFLKRRDRRGSRLEVVAYHAAVEDTRREETLARFTAPRADGADSADYSTQLVMVCTDRASRGVDSVGVDHVVLFDFPRDPSEYVRRVGRTARGASGRGVVSSLVMGRQVEIAQSILARNASGRPVERLPTL